MIAKAGRPIAKLTRLDAPATPAKRLGWYKNMPPVPDDFDEWMSDEITELFEGSESNE